MTDEQKQQELEVFNAALKRLKLTQAAAAVMLGVSVTTVHNWCTGVFSIPKEIFVKVLAIENKNHALMLERQKVIQETVERLNAGKDVQFTGQPKKRRGRPPKVK